MKFVVFVILISVTVTSVYSLIVAKPKGAVAPASVPVAASANAIPLSNEQISRIATALDKIVGPQLSRSVINTVTNGGMKSGLDGSGSGAGAGAGAGSGAGSGAGAGSGSGCACLFHPTFTVL